MFRRCCGVEEARHHHCPGPQVGGENNGVARQLGETQPRHTWPACSCAKVGRRVWGVKSKALEASVNEKSQRWVVAKEQRPRGRRSAGPMYRLKAQCFPVFFSLFFHFFFILLLHYNRDTNPWPLRTNSLNKLAGLKCGLIGYCLAYFSRPARSLGNPT